MQPKGEKDNDKVSWDAVFQPLGSSKTYAEMSLEEKNFVSHRYRAFEKLKHHLEGGNSEIYTVDR